MPKPLLVCKFGYSITDCERYSVLLQNKMTDWHVLVLPKGKKEEVSFEVYSVVDAHDHLTEELRQLIRETLCH